MKLCAAVDHLRHNVAEYDVHRTQRRAQNCEAGFGAYLPDEMLANCKHHVQRFRYEIEQIEDAPTP